MKIDRIDAYLLGFSPEPALGNAQTFIRRRDFMLVSVTTDCGKTGWGEVFNAPFGAAAFIRTKLAPILLGQPVVDRIPLFEKMRAVLAYDRRGTSRMALSALDMAIHDAAGQVLGLSVAQLLGGPLRHRVFAYASGPFISESDGYDLYADQVEDYLKGGFRAVKPRAGMDPLKDGKMVMALRKQVGDDIGLMVDINQGYTLAGAIESLRRMEEAGLMWAEEPLQPEDLRGYKALAGRCRTALAGGEALGTPAAFRDYLEAGTFAVLQPDPTVCGGFTGYRQISALGMAYDTPTIPHSFGTIVNATASLHLAALEPVRRGGGPAPYPYVEYDMTPNPLLALRPMPLDSNGFMALSDAPGLGLDLKPEELEPWLTESWSIAAE
ncbi:mandelate racemase/muconate lactonizing enzyme family protein [Sagittula sp.]|uniref:mandelate racemase/muconate lactonizing enzyme family protein n=1 Tax=Sagittula sp. TaxID=2038081 RepID=UPI0035128B29